MRVCLCRCVCGIVFLCLFSSLWHFIGRLVLLSSHSQKHNLYFNILFCSLSPFRSWRLRPDGGLFHMMPFSFAYQIYISCNITLNWTKRSSFWSCRSQWPSRPDWQLDPLTSHWPESPLPPQLSSKPDPTEEKTQCLLDGFEHPCSSQGCPKCFHSIRMNPSQPHTPPSQLKCDKHVFAGMCGLWLGFFFPCFDQGVQQYNNSSICQHNI